MSAEKKIALVTGGIGGIGTAICKRLATDGYQVIASHLTSEQDLADAWQKKQTEEGFAMGIAAGDVSNAEDAARMIAAVQQQYGTISVLVNCAGITRDRTFRKMEALDWQMVINTNLSSVFNVTKPVWEGMLAQNFGRIINISSVNGQRGQFGQTNYSAAKAGMHGFTMALAQEGAAKGVTVNTISPGYVATAMTAAMRQDVVDSIVATIPMRRMARPEEIAAAVSFLAAEENGYVTGANIPVNGGLFIH
jgi:acetoacetyl-CoA reductase